MSAFRAELAFCHRAAAFRADNHIVRDFGHDLFAALQTELCIRRKRCTTFYTLCRRIYCGGLTKRIAHSPTDGSCNSTADTCHCAKTDTEIGELADSLVSCDLGCDIEATLLLIGVAFLRALGCLRLRVDDDLLRFGLCVNKVGLLAKFGFRNVSILAEV